MRTRNCLGATLAAQLILMGCAGGQPAPVTSAPAFTPRGAPGETRHWTFEADQAGGPSSGAQTFSGTWAVRAEEGAPSPPRALCRTATAEFPALSLGDAVYTDLTLTTRFKPVAHRERLA